MRANWCKYLQQLWPLHLWRMHQSTTSAHQLSCLFRFRCQLAQAAVLVIVFALYYYFFSFFKSGYLTFPLFSKIMKNRLKIQNNATDMG